MTDLSRATLLLFTTGLFIITIACPTATTAEDDVFITRTMRSLPAGRTLTVRGPSPDRQGLILVGTRGYDDKNERLRVITDKRLTLHATAYSPERPSTYPHTDGETAIGLPAGYGIVAVDPQVVPLGTALYVENYGYAIAADVGEAIEGQRIDLCFDQRKNALAFGQKDVTVYVLGWAGSDKLRRKF